MNYHDILSKMSLLSDDDIIKSMNAGSIPPWAGVGELNMRKNAKGANGPHKIDSVLDEALGNDTVKGYAQGGLVSEEPLYKGPVIDLGAYFQQMLGGIGTPLPQNPVQSPPIYGDDGGQVRWQPQRKEPRRNRKSERTKARVPEPYYPESAGVNSPSHRSPLPAGGVSSLISSMPGDMGGIEAPLSNNFHRASVFTDNVPFPPMDPSSQGMSYTPDLPVQAQPRFTGGPPTRADMTGTPEAWREYAAKAGNPNPEQDVTSIPSAVQGAKDMYGRATTPNPGDPAWLWALKNGAKTAGDMVGQNLTEVGGLMGYPYEAGSAYGDLVKKNLKQVMSPRFSSDSSAGMSYTPSLPASPAGGKEPPVPQKAMGTSGANPWAQGGPGTPGGTPGLPMGNTNGMPGNLSGEPASTENEDWVKKQIESTQSEGQMAMPFSEMIKGMLPSGVDNSATLAQMRSDAMAGRKESQMLALMAFGSGMAGAPGSFAMGVGAGGAAMTPVAQQGLRDYQAALQEIAKETMGDQRTNADLQSRNANSIIAAGNLDINASNARDENRFRHLSALLEGKKLDQNDRRISAVLRAAELRATGKDRTGLTVKQLEDTARENVAKMIPPDALVGMTPEEATAKFNELVSKERERLIKQWGSPISEQSEPTSAFQVPDGAW